MSKRLRLRRACLAVPRKRSKRLYILILIGLGFLVGSGGYVLHHKSNWQVQPPTYTSVGRFCHPDTIFSMSSYQITNVDPAVVNLVVSQNIDSNEAIDLDAYTSRLDQFVQWVKHETERHYYRFQRNPREFDNSEAKFRLMLMGVTLWEDFQVRYNKRLTEIYRTASDAEFLSDSRTAFILGPMNPDVGGTCSSLPFLYAAVGRRLGYPLKMAHSHYHIYLRWVAPNEEFNIEVTGKGVDFPDDNHFRELDARQSGGTLDYTKQDEEAEGYFRTMSPIEEIAVIYDIRALCLATRGRYIQACQPMHRSWQFVPTPMRKQALYQFEMNAIAEMRRNGQEPCLTQNQ